MLNILKSIKNENLKIKTFMDIYHKGKYTTYLLIIIKLEMFICLSRN